MRRYLIVLCATLLSLLSWKVCASDGDDTPVPKMKSRFAVPVIKFLICQSWGYRRAFEEYAQLINRRYSEVQIQGENYPPPKLYQTLASILSIVKFVLIACILTGKNPFDFLGLETPHIYLWAQENMIYACFMLFFVSNAIETQLISTGAFEISLNEVTIWSKLKSGRIPQVNELMQIIDAHINMGRADPGGQFVQ